MRPPSRPSNSSCNSTRERLAEMIDRPNWSPGQFDNKGNEITPSDAPKSHEQIIAEMNAYPNPVPATTSPAASVPVPAKDGKAIVRADWGNPSKELAPPGEPIVDGIGYGQSLMNK